MTTASRPNRNLPLRPQGGTDATLLLVARSRSAPTTSPPRRPTGIALAAIGLGIWAFTVKSDLDDANDTIAVQQQRLAATQAAGSAAATDVNAAAADARQELDKTTALLLGNVGDVATLEQQLAAAGQRLDQAEAALKEAANAAQKRKAELDEVRAQAELASSCATSIEAATDMVAKANDPFKGIEAAAAELESLEPTCASVVR